MIELRAEHLERLERILEYTPQQVPIIAARAINRSAEAARTQASRSVRETYVIKHKDIVDTIRIKKASPNDLNADIRSRGAVINLTKFKVNPKKPQPNRTKPITVSVKKGSAKVFKNGFVAEMASGHMNVFTRVSKDRLPLKGHYGPSVPQMLGNESVVQFVEQKATEVLENRLIHETNRLVGGIT